ncbi:MAG TPA: hypothetical protein VN579_07250 [Bryobacteraceae bacterium]|nr:hypothetical protein [Bryobacteraceae bacterium]
MNQIGSLLYSHLLAFLGSTALLSMAASAILGTAPSQLPQSWREIPQWSWTWTIAAARQFWSLHHPASMQAPLPNQPAPSQGQKEEQ